VPESAPLQGLLPGAGPAMGRAGEKPHDFHKVYQVAGRLSLAALDDLS